jgi:nucleotide-binding universal stress UspA family protein
MEPSTILCATDLGNAGRRVVDQAAMLARLTGGSLHLIHVSDTGEDADLSYLDRELAPAATALRARLRARFERLSQELEAERARCASSGVACEASLEEGRPWERIVEAAARYDARAVVVGPHQGHRYGAIERMLGSTAARVVRHSPCSVLVVPEADDSDLGRGPWVVGVDLSPPAVDALREAVGLCRQHGIELILVHALPANGDAMEEGAEEWSSLVERWRGDIAARLAALGRAEADEGLVRTRVEVGEPAAVLAAAARELDAGLVVVGSHGRRGLSRSLLGSTAERTLRAVDRPVLVARRPERGR